MAVNEDDCYVKTGNKVYFGKDLKFGLVHTKVILNDGSFAEFDNHDITAYKHHDKIYMLMPVICDNNDTICLAMMEYITTKAGCTVFHYCCSNQVNLSLVPGDGYKSFFFIYKDGKFYKRINEDQTQALKTFGIKLI